MIVGWLEISNFDKLHITLSHSHSLAISSYSYTLLLLPPFMIQKLDFTFSFGDEVKYLDV